MAILIQGGIGGGSFSQGCPPISNIISGLSNFYDVTVYSILPANTNFIPSGFNFRTVHRRIESRKIRTILVCGLLLFHHLREPYRLFHAFWAYPAGTIIVLIGKLVKVPSLITIQGGEAAAISHLGYGNMLKPFLKRITLWTCEHATGLNSVSRFLLQGLSRHGLRRSDASINFFGADRKLFREETRMNGDLLRIIHVANLTEVKDQATLLKTFALILKELPAELKIVGGDFMEGKIQMLVDKMKLNDSVKFLGAIRNKDLPQHYAWANIMLHTSLHEGLPSVAAEAMACGLVVCATRVGIFNDLGDDYFETVEVGDYKALASKVVKLWRDKNKYDRLKEKSLAWAQEFDLSWTVAEFGKIYENMIRS